MHRLPLLAVGYIKIITHDRLACNCVVSSHTKPVVLVLSGRGSTGLWPSTVQSAHRRAAVLPILPGGPLLLCSSPMGTRLDTWNQRTFLGEATTQGRCIA